MLLSGGRRGCGSTLCAGNLVSDLIRLPTLKSVRWAAVGASSCGRTFFKPFESLAGCDATQPSRWRRVRS